MVAPDDSDPTESAEDDQYAKPTERGPMDPVPEGIVPTWGYHATEDAKVFDKTSAGQSLPSGWYPTLQEARPDAPETAPSQIAPEFQQAEPAAHESETSETTETAEQESDEDESSGGTSRRGGRRRR